MKFLAKLLTTSGLVIAGLLLYASSAHAATFTVNDNGDASAVDPSVSCDTAGDVCTLRSAIEAANAQAGADTVEFNIPGAGVHTITPGSDYPAITEQVTIDGTTQAGASCGTLVPSSLPGSNTTHTLLIEVDGSSVNHMFSLDSNNITMRGLAMHNGSEMIYSNPGSPIDNTLIECNYIGTNVAGTAAAGGTNAINIGSNNNSTIQNNLLSGTGAGLYIYTSSTVLIQNNLVGTNAAGTTAIGNSGAGLYTYNTIGATIQHNVASGNGSGGIIDQSSTGTTVAGNFAGLGVTGGALGNTESGITFFGSSNFTVGGTTATQRNVISANTGAGLHIYSNCNTGGSSDSATYGNYIGTTSSGIVQLGYGNGGAGVEVNEYQGSCESVFWHKIGGDAAGQANIIAGNTGQGLLIHQDSGHDVFSITAIVNSVYSNGQFGIDLAADSDTTSGVGDTDLGPNPLNSFPIMYPTGGYANNYLNRPTINSTDYTGNQLTVNYSFQAPSVQDAFPNLLASNLVGFRLDFYVNDAGQDGAYAGFSQGKTHIGSFIVDGTTSGATHVFTSPVSLQPGQVITATSTVLWQNLSDCNGTQQGSGPPYTYCGPT